MQLREAVALAAGVSLTDVVLLDDADILAAGEVLTDAVRVRDADVLAVGDSLCEAVSVGDPDTLADGDSLRDAVPVMDGDSDSDGVGDALRDADAGGPDGLVQLAPAGTIIVPTTVNDRPSVPLSVIDTKCVLPSSTCCPKTYLMSHTRLHTRPHTSHAPHAPHTYDEYKANPQSLGHVHPPDMQVEYAAASGTSAYRTSRISNISV